MGFEWNEKKNLENLQKHQISFEEAQTAFLDPNRLILRDEKHSQSEERYFCIGYVGENIATVRFYNAREGNQDLWSRLLERGQKTL